MCDHQTFSTALSILTAVITGGFILVFIELGSRKNRLIDSYYQIMPPFLKRLSAYCRFVTWSKSQLIYSKGEDTYEENFKKLVNQISHYGHMLIMSGGDFPIHQFTAKELNDIALDINNIWYWHDKMHPCKIQWEQSDLGVNEQINNELNKINPSYLSLKHDAYMVAKVSGDFYVDIYQYVENDTYKYEALRGLLHLQTIIVSAGVIMVLMLLSLMLFFNIPAIVLKWSTLAIILLLICCLLMLGLDMRKQVSWLYSVRTFFCKLFKRKKCFPIIAKASLLCYFYLKIYPSASAISMARFLQL